MMKKAGFAISLIGLVLALAGGAWAVDKAKGTGSRTIQTVRPTSAPEPIPFTCEEDRLGRDRSGRGRPKVVVNCTCTGVEDCVLMQEKGVCKGEMLCDQHGCSCEG